MMKEVKSQKGVDIRHVQDGNPLQSYEFVISAKHQRDASRVCVWLRLFFFKKKILKTNEKQTKLDLIYLKQPDTQPSSSPLDMLFGLLLIEPTTLWTCCYDKLDRINSETPTGWGGWGGRVLVDVTDISNT